jgi:hypothetical protein
MLFYARQDLDVAGRAQSPPPSALARAHVADTDNVVVEKESLRQLCVAYLVPLSAT